MTTRRQVAALPMRRAKNGGLEILLVTSRGTGRWIVPKGWTSKRLADCKAAAREARQEAGVKGKIGEQPVGGYRYVKSESGEAGCIDVDVYLLAVSKQCKRWPEMSERRRAWFGVMDAAEKIQEPELSALIRSLRHVSLSAALFEDSASLQGGNVIWLRAREAWRHYASHGLWALISKGGWRSLLRRRRARRRQETSPPRQT